MEQNPPNSPAPINRHIGIHIGVSSLFVKGMLLVIGGALIGAVIAYLYAANQFKVQNDSKTITIKASGSVEIEATEANISGYLNDYEKKYTTATEAELSAKSITDKLKTDLAAIGIPNQSVVISSYASPDYKYEYYSVPTPAPVDGIIRQPSIPTANGYYSSISVSIILKSEDISKMDQVVRLLETNRLNPTSSLYATPTEEVKSEARKNALLDAKKQVDELEEIGDLKVKKIISVKDTSIDSKYQDPYYPTDSKIYIDYGDTTASYQVTLEVIYQLR